MVYFCSLIPSYCAVFASVLHLRPSSMAASLIGMSSLLAKPGESLAPMLGWKVLNLAGAASAELATTEDGSSDAAAAATATGAASGVDDARKRALLYLLLTLPLVTVGLQLALWSSFTLRGTYLRSVTQRVKELEGSRATAAAADDDRRDDREHKVRMLEQHEQQLMGES